MVVPKTHKDIIPSLGEIMREGEVQEFLDKIPANLKKIAVPVLFKKNSIVIMKDEPAEYAYFILDGNLALQNEYADGNIYKFSDLGKGVIIADLEVLSGEYKNAATAIAKVDTWMLRVGLSDFERELRTDLEFLYFVASHMAKKMYTSSHGRGMNLYKPGVSLITNYLIKYVKKTGFFEETVKIQKKRQEISDEIGISIRTVNRAVRELKNEGIISIVKGKITLNKKQYALLLGKAGVE